MRGGHGGLELIDPVERGQAARAWPSGDAWRGCAQIERATVDRDGEPRLDNGDLVARPTRQQRIALRPVDAALAHDLKRRDLGDIEHVRQIERARARPRLDEMVDG